MEKTEWMKNYLKTHNVALTGFMGAGKSTAAKMMSRMFDMKPVEMDALIAEREGMTINEIFAKIRGSLFQGKRNGAFKRIVMRERTDYLVRRRYGAPR